MGCDWPPSPCRRTEKTESPTNQVNESQEDGKCNEPIRSRSLVGNRSKVIPLLTLRKLYPHIYSGRNLRSRFDLDRCLSRVYTICHRLQQKCLYNNKKQGLLPCERRVRIPTAYGVGVGAGAVFALLCVFQIGSSEALVGNGILTKKCDLSR